MALIVLFDNFSILIIRLGSRIYQATFSQSVIFILEVADKILRLYYTHLKSK